MSTEITEAQRVQFGTNVMQLAQQRASRLRDTVTIEAGVAGKRFSRDQIGATSAQRRTSRHADTRLIEPPHYRRWANMADYDWAALIDDLDKFKLAIGDPTSAYAIAGGSAMGRTIDDVIIAAALADAVAGEEATSSVTFASAGTTIAVDSWAYGTGTGDAGLTVSKLIETKVALDAAEADPMGDPRTIVCAAKQLGNLLSTTQVTSADYNAVKALVNGEIDTFMGFKFVRSERLGTDGSGHRKVLAYQKSGIVLGVGAEPQTKIDQRPDKSYATQVFLDMSLGAVRLEEAKVVCILCDE